MGLRTITLGSEREKQHAVTDGLILPKYEEGQHSEFEIQANLYRSLVELGLKVRGEVSVRGNRKKHPRRVVREMSLTASGRWQCRFDLVIYDGSEAVHIVEVKNGKRPVTEFAGHEHRTQEIRYRQFGLPVTFIYGMDGAREFLIEMARMVSK